MQKFSLQCRTCNAMTRSRLHTARSVGIVAPVDTMHVLSCVAPIAFAPCLPYQATTAPHLPSQPRGSPPYHVVRSYGNIRVRQEVRRQPLVILSAFPQRHQTADRRSQDILTFVVSSTNAIGGAVQSPISLAVSGPSLYEHFGYPPANTRLPASFLLLLTARLCVIQRVQGSRTHRGQARIVVDEDVL